MTSSNIAGRYARAFFEIAGQDRRYEDYGRELGRFSALLKGNRDLNEFLANPLFTPPDKKAVVEAILRKAGSSELTANFLKLLVDKRRIGVISDIENRYRELMDETLNKVRVTVGTAFPLTGELAAQLQEGLEKMTGKQVEMTVDVDASLLGGVIVRIGDMIYDGTIRTQLKKINDLLGEEI